MYHREFQHRNLIVAVAVSIFILCESFCRHWPTTLDLGYVILPTIWAWTKFHIGGKNKTKQNKRPLRGQRWINWCLLHKPGSLNLFLEAHANRKRTDRSTIFQSLSSISTLSLSQTIHKENNKRFKSFKDGALPTLPWLCGLRIVSGSQVCNKLNTAWWLFLNFWHERLTRGRLQMQLLVTAKGQ